MAASASNLKKRNTVNLQKRCTSIPAVLADLIEDVGALDDTPSRPGK
jgi:hypothetical protein